MSKLFRDFLHARKFRDFTRDKRGATAIEYSLIATLIASVIIVAVFGLGGNVSALYNTIAVAVTGR